MIVKRQCTGFPDSESSPTHFFKILMKFDGSPSYRKVIETSNGENHFCIEMGNLCFVLEIFGRH